MRLLGLHGRHGVVRGTLAAGHLQFGVSQESKQFAGQWETYLHGLEITLAEDLLDDVLVVLLVGELRGEDILRSGVVLSLRTLPIAPIVVSVQ